MTFSIVGHVSRGELLLLFHECPVAIFSFAHRRDSITVVVYVYLLLMPWTVDAFQGSMRVSKIGMLRVFCSRHLAGENSEDLSVELCCIVSDCKNHLAGGDVVR